MTISVPLPQHLTDFIQNQIVMGYSENKAEVVRKALVEYEKEQAIQAVLISQEELKKGHILRGNLKDIAKKII